MQQMLRTSTRLLWLALPALVTLAGCSSKPEAADIERGLAQTYNCPALQVRDVKKLNGAPGPQGTYDVAFSYVVAMKGGETAAVKSLTEGVFLSEETRSAGPAVNALKARATNGRGDGPSKELTDYLQQVDARNAELFPCDVMDSESWTILGTLLEQAKATMKTGGGKGAFQIGANITRTGRMTKTENGWVFAQISQGFDDAQALVSKPAAFTLTASKLPALLTAGDAQTSVTGERTLVGTIRAGQTDNCLEVTAAGATKCYGLPGEAALVQRIFSVCKDGDACSVTGQFDDKAESLVAFSKVEKATR